MGADNLDKLDAVIGAMTPGPWAACPMDVYVLGGDGHFVAEVRGFGAEVSGQRPEGTQQANARGIATLRNVAPELLAVVRAMRAIRDGDWWEVRHKDVQRGANALDALYAKIREVL